MSPDQKVAGWKARRATSVFQAPKTRMNLETGFFPSSASGLHLQGPESQALCQLQVAGSLPAFAGQMLVWIDNVVPVCPQRPLAVMCPGTLLQWPATWNTGPWHASVLWPFWRLSLKGFIRNW